MNIKLKENSDKISLFAGLVLLVLALGFMAFKIYDIQSQVSDINSKQNIIQTVPPSQQLTPEAAARKKTLDALKTAKPVYDND